jgi:hypothetical protein
MNTLGKITLFLDDIISQAMMENIHDHFNDFLVIESSCCFVGHHIDPHLYLVVAMISIVYFMDPNVYFHGHDRVMFSS